MLANQCKFLQICILIFVGISILFWEILFLGYVQVPGDILFLDPVWQHVDPPDFERPNNLILLDHIKEFYIWHSIAAKSMQQEDHIPSWNPYIFAGQPLVANSQSALFYPPNLLLFWLTPGKTANIRVMFNIFIGGVFTFLFCRSLNISPNGAILAGVSFAFSGPIMVGPGHPYANVLVWLPFLLWAGQNALKNKRPYFWSYNLSLGVGLTFLGGHIQTTFHVLFLSFFYLIIRWHQQSFVDKQLHLTRFGFAFGLGLILGAVQLFPFVDFLTNSAIISRAKIETTSVFYSPVWLSNLTLFITLLYPNFYGNPQNYNYYWPFIHYQNYLEQTMYFGLLPCALACGMAMSHHRHRVVRIITFIIIGCLLVALRLPLFEGVSHLPIFSMVNHTRLKWMVAFFGAVLAGFGLDELRAILTHQQRNRQFIISLKLIMGIALTIWGSVMVGKYFAKPLLGWPHYPFTDHLFYQIFAFNQIKTTITVLVVWLSIAGYYLFTRGAMNWLNFERLLISLTFLELLVLGRGYNTTMPEALVMPEIDFIKELQAYENQPFRILATDDIFWPNYGAVYGLSHVGGIDLPVFETYANLYWAQAHQGNGYSQRWSPEWALVDWLNVKYIIGTKSQSMEKYQLVFESGPIKLHKNKQALPRAYLVQQTEIITDDEKALQTITSGSFNFQHKVILANASPKELAAVSQNQSLQGSVNITEYKNDSVSLQVETSTAAFLVMSDLYTPDWQATLDNQPVPLYKANYAFRSVFIPPGQHTVSMTYRPVAYQVGFILSIAGMLIIILGLPITYRYHVVEK